MPVPQEITTSPVALGLRTALAFGGLMGLFFAAMAGVAGVDGLTGWSPLTTMVVYGVVGGVASGILFGGMMASFVARMRTPPDQLDFDGEAVVAWGPASHLVGREAVGGHLYLTDARLRFVSHGANLSDHDTSWPRDELGGTRVEATFGVLRNRWVVEMGEGPEVFVVSDPDRWCEASR